MIKVIYSFKEKKTDISSFTGDIGITNSLGTLGSSCSFSVVRNKNDDEFNLVESIEVGGKIGIYKDNEKIFTGIIISLDKSKYEFSIKALDFAFYLNKNKVVKQFKKLNAKSCIEKLCSSVGIKVGSTPALKTNITFIYKDKTVASIILDMLDKVLNETGVKYTIEVDGDTLNIVKYGSIKVQLPKDGFVSEGSLSESIEDMKNSIRVTSNNQDEVNIMNLSQDSVSIRNYGVLQEIIEVDPSNNKGKVNNIGRKKLDELSKVERKVKFSCDGSIDLKPGRLISINNSDLSISGEFLIDSVSHKIFDKEIISELEVEEFHGS